MFLRDYTREHIVEQIMHLSSSQHPKALRACLNRLDDHRLAKVHERLMEHIEERTKTK